MFAQIGVYNLKLLKSKDLSCNGLRHHAATFSKLDSNNPLYHDHMATSLGHSLHIHKKYYDLPTTINQKLIVYPVLRGMTVTNVENNEECGQIPITLQDEGASESITSTIESVPIDNRIKRKRCSDKEKEAVYDKFGPQILLGNCPKWAEIESLK